MKNQTKSTTAPATGKRGSKGESPQAVARQSCNEGHLVHPPQELATKPAGTSEGKGATILRLNAREQGAALAELMEATGWLRHSVRGFTSTARKARIITSTKSDPNLFLTRRIPDHHAGQRTHFHRLASVRAAS